MTNHFKRLMQDSCGATAVEYGLLVALISFGIIAAKFELGLYIRIIYGVIAAGMGGPQVFPLHL